MISWPPFSRHQEVVMVRQIRLMRVEISAEDDSGSHVASALRTRRELSPRCQGVLDGVRRFCISGAPLVAVAMAAIRRRNHTHLIHSWLSLRDPSPRLQIPAHINNM